MTQSPRIHIKDSIATQLIIAVFSLYFILTITVTFIHMSAEFFNTKDHAKKELKALASTHSPGLAKAMWDVDIEQLLSTFRGIVEFPMVEGVKVEDEWGHEVGAYGLVRTGNGNVVNVISLRDRIPIEGYTGLFEFSFPIFFKANGKKIKVGKATIFSSKQRCF